VMNLLNLTRQGCKKQRRFSITGWNNIQAPAQACITSGWKSDLQENQASPASRRLR